MANQPSCGTGSSPNSIPGMSSACAVTFDRNNTAILAECCNDSSIASYTDFAPAPAQDCYQYCNISTPFYNESSTYRCLTDRERNRTLTGWSCRDEVKEAGAGRRGIDRVMFGIVAAVAVVVALDLH
ncbi:hypothetical protein BKA64DRAFT_699700 [Cadophora sp. MPI-SDFR-AT-0126]|nr:hypothetical protein BKA64DRAFT_699700 [Leotiomycetes sp. MPI-SDFR-AT-0126]